MCCKKLRDKKGVKNSKFMQRWGKNEQIFGLPVADAIEAGASTAHMVSLPTSA
jgi:hypothetical protein